MTGKRPAPRRPRGGPALDENPIVMGVTPRPRGLDGRRSRWMIVVAAAIVGCLDVIALIVVLTLTG